MFSSASKMLVWTFDLNCGNCNTFPLDSLRISLEQDHGSLYLYMRYWMTLGSLHILSLLQILGVLSFQIFWNQQQYEVCSTGNLSAIEDTLKKELISWIVSLQFPFKMLHIIITTVHHRLIGVFHPFSEFSVKRFKLRCVCYLVIEVISDLTDWSLSGHIGCSGLWQLMVIKETSQNSGCQRCSGYLKDRQKSQEQCSDVIPASKTLPVPCRLVF